MKVRRILVPVDFCEGSLTAVRHAQRIAVLTGSHVHLLHVTDAARSMASRGGLNDVGDLRCDGRLRSYHRLANVIASLQLDPFHTTGMIRKGVPHEVIVGYAGEIHADLIVMGIHGEDQTPPHSPGRVIERVLGTARCPVLAVPDDGDRVWAQQQSSRADAAAECVA